MSALGKSIRLNRLFGNDGSRVFIFAIDHGLSSPSFLPHLEDTPARVREAIAGGANGVIVTRGIARQVQKEFRRDTAFVLSIVAVAHHPKEHLVASVGGVEEALRLDADAVAVFVPLGDESESQVLGLVGTVGEACERYGMPLMLEAEYPDVYRPQGITGTDGDLGLEYLKHSVRVCTELGADLIEVNWPGDENAFRELAGITSVPLVLAGGGVLPERELLSRVKAALAAGAAGCCLGRSVFQHRDARALCRAVAMIVFDNADVEASLREL
jgi:class I fructose-bisphosphate aldolase